MVQSEQGRISNRIREQTEHIFLGVEDLLVAFANHQIAPDQSGGNQGHSHAK